MEPGISGGLSPGKELVGLSEISAISAYSPIIPLNSSVASFQIKSSEVGVNQPIGTGRKSTILVLTGRTTEACVGHTRGFNIPARLSSSASVICSGVSVASSLVRARAGWARESRRDHVHRAVMVEKLDTTLNSYMLCVDVIFLLHGGLRS